MDGVGDMFVEVLAHLSVAFEGMASMIPLCRGVLEKT
jgi:hypothetical protein